MKRATSLSLLITSIVLLFTGGFSGFKAYKESQVLKMIKEDYAAFTNVGVGLASSCWWANKLANKTQIFADSIRGAVNLAVGSIISDSSIQNSIDSKAKSGVKLIGDGTKKVTQNVVGFGETNCDLIQHNICLKYDSIANTYNVSDMRLHTDECKNSIQEVMKSSQAKLDKWVFLTLFLLSVPVVLLFFFGKKIDLRKIEAKGNIDDSNYELNKLLQATWLYIPAILACSLLILFGISIPLMDVDIRLKSYSIDVAILTIETGEQQLYYQCKSILDVIKVLCAGTGSTFLAGMMIFLFSVVMPLLKMMVMLVSLFSRNSSDITPKINTFLSHFSKLSMADVMVVAVFIAIIGFQGIAEQQAQQFAGANAHGILESHTAIQNGFWLFLAYCLFSLFLSLSIEKHINRILKPME